MVVMIAAAIVLVNLIPEDTTDTGEKKDPPEILEGEALYNNQYPLAYPSVQESQIQEIMITNSSSYLDENGEPIETSYVLKRDQLADGKFVLLYQDQYGNPKAHYPDIVDMDASFDYESLYSIEGGDGYGRIYKLTYLCVALEMPYFDERIPLSSDAAELEKQKTRFGFDEPLAKISFKYKYYEKDENGKDVEKETYRNIVIGDKSVTGVGYYFMVSDTVDGEIVYRPYIYNSQMSNYYDYAMLGFYSYVNSVLVSSGLSEDSSYEPYLTTDYKQWLNETFKEPGTEIPENSSLIVYTDVFTPLESVIGDQIPEENKDGYIKDGYAEVEVDLSKKDRYGRFINALVGKKLGKFEKDIVITLTSDSKSIDFADAESINYQYDIFEIEAILTDAEDIPELGLEVGENNLVRAAYYLTVNEKKISDVPYHGVFDLSNEAFNAETVAKIRGSKIGSLEESVVLAVDYSAQNSVSMKIRYVIDEILSIYDDQGKETDKVTETSQVLYRYALVINGQKQGYETGFVDFAAKVEEGEENEITEKIKSALLGKEISKNLSITIYENTVYCEFVQDFMTYSVASAEYFVTGTLVSAFRYLNRSDRDPFYGESIYENTMNNEYSLYAINSSTCEAVAKMLGGIGDTTGASAGLVGFETVAVGITPEIKELYGLYAYTIYFELPRGIIVKDSGDDNTVDDYSQYSKLGFTLYISEELYDPQSASYIRYVGSDLYDIVAKVSADKLVFLKPERTFVDFWARRTLMMFNIKYLDEMKVEFMMEDLKGSYTFDVNVKNANDDLSVRVWENCSHTEECGCYMTNLRRLMDELRKENPNVPGTTLDSLYNRYYKAAEGEEIYRDSLGNVLFAKNAYDTAGVGNFRELMAILYAIPYEGYLSAEEQAEAMQSAPLLMRISIKLNTKLAENTSENYHVYEFYRCDDRRIMVRLYEADANGKMTLDGDVTDFYVTSLAFKKIVASYFNVLNAEKVDSEVAYPEVQK